MFNVTLTDNRVISMPSVAGIMEHPAFRGRILDIEEVDSGSV